jgi:DNA-directed RNA polymerase subunit RPC12/RpoP
MFNKFKRWLSGKYECVTCGNDFQLMTFGYGKTICPNCYHGGEKIISLDQNYWLNRFLSKIIEKEPTHKKQEEYDEILLNYQLTVRNDEITQEAAL